MSKLIGLSGYARAGKDSVADVLGFRRVSFADPMRKALYALNPIVRWYDLEYWRVQDVIDKYGWDGYKKSPFAEELRSLLQRFGTEVGREQFGANFWVDQAMRLVETYRFQDFDVVLTDVRFPNEAEAIRAAGGVVWRVRRPNVFPANDHVSEVGLDDWPFDRFIDNNGSLEDLEAVVWHGLE